MLEATGLPETWAGGNLGASTTLADPETGRHRLGDLGIGQYEMRPIDQAVGFATFAAGGVHRDPYFVAKVDRLRGQPAARSAGRRSGEQVIPADVANDVTFAIEGVGAVLQAARWTAGARWPARPAPWASTDQDNSDAWMVGYTPSISTAVWMGLRHATSPIVNADGKIIYGSGLPGAIWQKFMNAVLKGTPKENLPDKALIQGDTGEGVPEPTTSSAADARPPRRPTSRRRPTPTDRGAADEPADRRHRADATTTPTDSTGRRRATRPPAAATVRRPTGTAAPCRGRPPAEPIPHTEHVSSAPPGPSAPRTGPASVAGGAGAPGPPAAAGPRDPLLGRTRWWPRPARRSAARGAGTR